MMFLLPLFVIACNDVEQIVAPKVTPLPTVPVVPYRHPSFTPDSSWIEDNAGMRLIYESADFAKSWSFNIVSDTSHTVRAGWKAQRFEVRSGDCYMTDCTRTNPMPYERNEFAQAGGENNEGDEYWYGFSFYVPSNTEQANWTSYAQFQQHSNYDPIWIFRKNPGQPLCAVFDIIKNNMVACTGQRQTWALIEDVDFTGRWHDIVVHAKWTQQNNGFTRIYVNGELKVDYTGYTRTTGNTDVYFKYGIYRWAATTTSVAYFDEIRRGKTREEVDIRLLGK